MFADERFLRMARLQRGNEDAYLMWKKTDLQVAIDMDLELLAKLFYKDLEFAADFKEKCKVEIVRSGRRVFG